MKKVTGIYIITNVINHKQYIGSSVHVPYRIKRHFQLLRDGIHVNKKLQNSYNKYGKNAFVHTCIENCLENQLIEREQYYIDTLNPFYNVCKTAGSVYGLIHTKETIKLCVEANKLRAGTHHYGKNGLVQKLEKTTEEVLETYTSGRHAAEFIINSKGSIKTIGCKISQAANKNIIAYGYKWRHVKLAQVKQDELLED